MNSDPNPENPKTYIEVPETIKGSNMLQVATVLMLVGSHVLGF